MTHVRGQLLASVAGLVLVGGVSAASADQLLTGSITSASGQKLEGVLVSAKKEGSTITTSVYTDQNGEYFFPAMADGKYDVWAQTLGFKTAKGAVDLSATKHQDLQLAAITDPDERIRQMPPEMLAAALPEEAEADANIKRIFHNQCTGCHTPGYPLQFKFDEAGWSKVINFMKTIPQIPGPNARVNAIINYNQKELAAYLARARGPGESSMKFKDRPRPSGENARVVWQTYDVPLNPDTGIAVQGAKYPVNDGYDWNLGTPSKLGQLPHDGAMGFDGNLYYTVNNPNSGVTVGKVDTKTGEVKYLKVDRKDGKFASTAHGLTRDANGDLWFDVNPGRRSLGKLEVKTEKISVYETPEPMSPLGGAVTLDVDGKGRIWASAPDGVVAFDPATEKFTDFKSILPFKNAKGTNSTYGAAGDRDGNGWWAQMAFDTIGKADMTNGKTTEITLPSLKDEMARLPEAKRAFYENFADRTNGNPLPWAQGPRRMGTDKNADVLWVGNSWGATLARIDTKTGQSTIIPFPDPAYQPYHIAVDQNHNVWGNLWTADRLAKYDPAKGEWTLFDLPVRGTEIRHISLLEKDGVTKVIVPVYRDSMMGVMTLRTEADIAALKTAAK
ncbi:MAG TPA: carboxypeptidase regulatory-like domain-containing protein [Xanthobacteraceae bacterium]|nr:carboxypeptidase regulatory-like domain-containing protein [Xanthobacteraceae bacterium]